MNYAEAKLRGGRKHKIFYDTQEKSKKDDIVYCPVSQNFELVEGFLTTQGISSRCAFCYKELD